MLLLIEPCPTKIMSEKGVLVVLNGLKFSWTILFINCDRGCSVAFRFWCVRLGLKQFFYLGM